MFDSADLIVYFILLLVVGFIGWLGQWGRQNKFARYGVYGVIGFLSLGALALGSIILSGIFAPLFFTFHISMAPLGLLFLSVGILGVLSLIPPVRKLLSITLFKGLEPDTPAHTWALFMYGSALLFTGVSIVAFYSPSAIISNLKSTPLMLSVGYNTVGFLMFSILAVGIGIHLSWPEVFKRLGLTGLAPKTIGILLGISVVLWFSMQTFEDTLLTFISADMKATLQQIVDAMRLTGSMPSILLKGVLVGLGAGIGEETLFRGLMQPVFGILPTALLFALIHLHYGPTLLLLELFIVGIILGLIRNRLNTTAAIIVHSSFDIIALLAANLHS